MRRSGLGVLSCRLSVELARRLLSRRSVPLPRPPWSSFDGRSSRIGGAGRSGVWTGNPTSGTEGKKRSWWTTLGFMVKCFSALTNWASRTYSLRTVFSSHHMLGGSACPGSLSNFGSAGHAFEGGNCTASGNRNSKGYSIRFGGQFALGAAVLCRASSWRKRSVEETC